MDKLNLAISGMTCGHCVAAVSSALKKVEGVTVNRVNVGSASVSYDPSLTGPEEIREAIKAAGYPAEAA